MTNEETLRDQAAKPTLLRIRTDVDGASQRLQPLLVTVKKRLFEGSFNVQALWREHKIRDKNAPAIFKEIDTVPRAYILRGRMETAERLLLQTPLAVSRIGRLVGYLNPVSFRKAFKKWKGCTPSELRERHGLVKAGFEQTVADALAGQLSPSRVGDLMNRLKALLVEMQCLFTGPLDELQSKLVDAAKLEQIQVETLVLPRLAFLSFDEQRHVVQRSRPFSTPALFDALHRESRDQGRQDRQRGVELSQLALDSVEANAESLGPLYHTLRPQAWAWLGNAYRLGLDFVAADRAIDEAVEVLHSTVDLLTAGIVYLCQGTLRTFQRRHDEAVEVFDVALPAFEGAGDEPWQIATLNHRATALRYAESHEEALATLTKAAALPGAASEPFATELLRDIAITLVRLGRFSDAENQLLTLRDESMALHWRHRWIEAYVAQGIGRLEQAEEKYLATAKMLEELDEPLYRALLLLDLVVLYADQKRTADVIPLCNTIYPVFESLRLYDETMASVRLLGQAISESCVSTDVLRSLRSSLRRDPLARV